MVLIYNRDQADGFISNGCSSSASNGNLPKFENGSGNDLADFLTIKMKEYKNQNGIDSAQNYLALRYSLIIHHIL